MSCTRRLVRHGAVLGLATYHPAAALRGDPRVVATMRADLAVLRELMERT